MSRGTRKSKRGLIFKRIILLIIGGYLFFSFSHMAYVLYQTNAEIKYYEEKKQALLTQRTLLEEQIRQLDDDQYIERLAREELGLVKPGERLIIPAVPGQTRPYVPPKPGDRFGD